MDNQEIRAHFDNIAKDYDFWKHKNWYYYGQLKKFYERAIPAGRKVLELGCGTGEILNCVKPSEGVGIDISCEMIKIAQKKFQNLKFIKNSAEEPPPIKNKFDYIIISDLLDHVPDIGMVFRNMECLAGERPEVVITTINPVWDPIFMVLEKLKLKMPEGPHHFLFGSDIVNALELSGYNIKDKGAFLLLPLYIPFVSVLFNRYLSRLPFMGNLCVVQYIIAQKGNKSSG